MKSNIVLIGLMGAGKTTIGNLLADTIDKEFIDTDKLIEDEAQKTINEIFEHYGEELFRKLEKHTIKTIAQEQNKIISTGGGSVEYIENIENLKTNGVLFYLKATPEHLFERIKFEATRPLLKNANPLGTLKKLLEKREPFYEMADEIISTEDKNSADIVKEIIERYKKYANQDCNC